MPLRRLAATAALLLSLGGPAAAAQSQATAIARVPSGRPLFLRPHLGQRHYDVSIGHDEPGTTDFTVYRPALTVNLTFTAAFQDQYAWRWQVALTPFAADDDSGGGAVIASGDAGIPSFSVPLDKFPPLGGPPPSKESVPVALVPQGQGAGRLGIQPPPSKPPASQRSNDLPRSFYIRVMGFLNGKPAGPPSNVVVVHYQPGPAPIDSSGRSLQQGLAAQAHLAQMTAEAQGLQVTVTGFTPVKWAQDQWWGCVVVDQNPYAGISGHPLYGFIPGNRFCGRHLHQQADQDLLYWIGAALDGWVHSYDVMSTFYNGTKDWVAGKIVSVVPCEELGHSLEDDCNDVVSAEVEAGLSAGLVAAGLPPALPSYAQLKAAAEDGVTEAAVELTCQSIEANGGVCTEDVREGLRWAYHQGLKQLEESLQREATEPACGDAAAAAEHDRAPLPCFSNYPGTRVHPAPGALEEPATVALHITRVRLAPAFPMPGCKVSAVLVLSNHFPGGYLGGVNTPPKDISGWAFEPAVSGLPSIPLGQSIDLTLPFTRPARFEIAGHNTAWYVEDWPRLYFGGVGQVLVSASTTGPVPGALSSGKPQVLPCAAQSARPVQLPAF